MIDKHPFLISRCRGVSDVIQSVNFARENKIILAIFGGGHNIAGSAVCDGGLMLDLSQMKSIRVDLENQTVRVEAGATLSDVDHETQAFGLAVPLGINSTTGVAGLTLGGGFGWLSRKYGLTIDNLISADVVLADGTFVNASKNENADLFWAIRGGGGNFGVVTSFEFQLHQVGPTVLAGLIIHPLEDAPKVLRFYRDFIEKTPDEFVCWFVLRKAPPLPFLAPEWHGKEILALAVLYSGKLEDGEVIAKPLRQFGNPLADVLGPQLYSSWQKVLDPLLTPGARNYWKTHDFLSLDDGLIETLIKFAKSIPEPQTEIAFAQLGGAVSRVPIEDTAYTHRDAKFVVNVHGRWEDPAKDNECITWARNLFHEAQPFATGGAYINFLTQEEQDRIPAAYGKNYNKLIKMKNKFDPANLFCVNQNIKPGPIKSH
jgi:FAD/FMN-containing dehydrogenase